MNKDTLTGSGRDLGGQAKEAAGKVTGDSELEGAGKADQLSGKVQNLAGSVSEALGGKGPLVDKAKGFAKQRPFAAAALAGVVGIALLNTLRGKRA